jgi:ribosomal-protein-alanine N-acetyltransferase
MSHSAEFRLATVSDAAVLAMMSRDLIELGLGWSWTQSRITRHIRSAESVVVVARSHGLIAGFAIMRFGREEAHLDLLAVKPKYRRTGLGRGLIEWLEKSALVAGISVIYLEVRETKSESRAFYEKLGYRRVKRLPGYYRGRESAICMGRDLWGTVPSASTKQG